MDDAPGDGRRRGSNRAAGRRRERPRDRGPQSPRDRATDDRVTDDRATDDRATDDRAADPDADLHSVAKAIALRQLTMAPRSRAQLRQAMDRKLVPLDVADEVLDRLEEIRLVDDAAFAEGYVRYRRRERGLARRALAHELRTKGVDDETARSVLDHIDPDDELQTARALVARRLPSTRRLDREVRIRRLAGMLARKGYPPGTAMTVVREALATEGDDLAEDEAWPG